ncbi:phage major capsid protein, partial [Mycobacteroides abscessus subsp. abscessus]
MTMLHTTTADAFTPEDFGDLVDLAVKAKSIATRTGTVVGTDKVRINFPIWVSDPAVGWYAENATIS